MRWLLLLALVRYDGVLTVCSGYVHGMFMACSWYVYGMLIWYVLPGGYDAKGKKMVRYCLGFLLVSMFTYAHSTADVWACSIWAAAGTSAKACRSQARAEDHG